jgi:hypothetical protein
MGLNNFTTKGGGSAEFTDVDSDNITNSGQIDTDGLEFAGTTELENIESVSTSNGAPAVVDGFSNITDNTSDRTIVIKGRFLDGGVQQDVNIRFNGDGPSQTNYRFQDQSNTQRKSQSEIKLLTQNSAFNSCLFSFSVGRVFDHVLEVRTNMNRQDRAQAVARRGGRNDNVPLDSIEIIPSSGTDGLVDIQAFERRII